MKSTAFDVTAMSKALIEAIQFIVAQVLEEQNLKPTEPMKWIADSSVPQQVQLVQRYKAVFDDLASLPELKAWAKKTAEELNAILAEHGFSIRLEPWEESKNRFGVVAIYDITIEWLVTGDTEDKGGRPYWLVKSNKPAFRLSADDALVYFFSVDGRVVVRIPGKKTGDYLCITKADARLEQFKLLEFVESLRANINVGAMALEYGGVLLPNILFDTGADGINIDWLAGLWTEDVVGDPWVIMQAKMQAKFAMGPKGARAKLAVAVGLERMMSPANLDLPKPDYVCDHDVIFWMERDGVKSEPFFVAYVPADEFADRAIGLDEIDAPVERTRQHHPREAFMRSAEERG